MGTTTDAANLGLNSQDLAKTRALVANDGNRNRLPRWRAALAARAAGTRNAKLMVVSDSTGVGAYAPPSVSAAANAKGFCWSALLNAALNNAGIPSNYGATFGDCSNSTTPATLSTYDPRVSLGANWTLGAFYTFGGGVVNNATAGSQTVYSFTPAEVFDTIEVTYITNTGYGQFSIAVDGGAAIGAAVNCNAALAAAQTTRTTTRGTHRVDIFRSAPTGADGALPIVSVRVWDSTRRTVDILNASVNGTTTTLQSATASAFSALNVGPVYAPDLTIICLDINDWANSVAPGMYDLVTTTTHSFQLQKIITAYRATGDVVLMTGAPSATGTFSQAVQDGIYTATRNLAAVNNIPLIDIDAEWGRYVAAAAAGYYTPWNDVTHPGPNGHANIAARVMALPGFLG